MTELISLEFAGLPPTINHAHINAHGRRFRSRQCRDFQTLTTLLLQRAYGNKSPYSGPVALDIIFTARNKRRWDIDNRVKPLQDCLTLAGVIKDDSQVEQLFIKKLYSNSDQTKLVLKILKE